MEKLLLVEDDDTIRSSLKFFLEDEGFSLTPVSSCKEALEKIDNSFDLALLDINLPDGNGFDLLKDIKNKVDIPIIFLTASDIEVSIVRGLDMGADDYITKPFKARELVSRIKMVLRRAGKNNNPFLAIKNIKIDLFKNRVLKDDKEIFLSPLEYKILVILMSNPNQVFTREQILADIWDVNEDYVNDNTLTVYIKRIREKLDDQEGNFITTVRKVGYMIKS